MKLYTKKCPACGAENSNLLLEDTGGWMECERCGCVSWFSIKVPVEQIPLEVRAS